jgi:hypothetical protein
MNPGTEEPGEERKPKRVVPFLIGLVLLALICVPIAVVVTLILAGPVVGNVFSQIVDQLEEGIVVEGQGYRLRYPATWHTLEEMPEICQHDKVECLLHIAPAASDGSNLNVLRFEVGTNTTIEDFDDDAWAAITGNSPEVVLLSREFIEVGEHSAAKRLFEVPPQSGSDVDAYIEQVYVLGEGVLYQFTLWTPNAASLEVYGADVSQILKSFELTS